MTARAGCRQSELIRFSIATGRAAKALGVTRYSIFYDPRTGRLESKFCDNEELAPANDATSTAGLVDPWEGVGDGEGEIPAREQSKRA